MKMDVGACREREKTITPVYEYFLSTAWHYSLQRGGARRHLQRDPGGGTEPGDSMVSLEGCWHSLAADAASAGVVCWSRRSTLEK